METMLNNIVHISLLETQALTQGKDPEEMETFDITEHKIELQVNRDDDLRSEQDGNLGHGPT